MSESPLVLASASPRRHDLLALMGLECDVIPSGVDESTIPADHPRTFALRAAYAKALDVAAKVSRDRIVLAADTVVTLENRLLGKPTGRNDARRMLEFLSGREHQVITGVAVARAGRPEVNLDSETSGVVFRALSAQDLMTYLDRASYFDKAGAYGIQEHGGDLVERLDGDYYNVMGLPCALVARMLHPFYGDRTFHVPEPPARWRKGYCGR